VVRAGNTRLDALPNRYNIDPKELIAAQKQARQAGLDIVGFYHSHPNHPPRWSQTDLAEAHWIGCSYVITSVLKGKTEVTNSFALAAGRKRIRDLRMSRWWWSDSSRPDGTRSAYAPAPALKRWASSSRSRCDR